MTKWNIGDVVKLKGTDVHMVVRWFREGPSGEVSLVACQWFDKNLHIQEYEFRPITLEVVSSRSSD